MKPYYQDDCVTLFHGDCLEVTDWLNADVLVTDPPYGMGYESNFNRVKRAPKVGRPVVGDRNTAARDEVLRLWGDKPAVVFGRWDITRPEQTRARLIWDRMYHGMGDLSFPWGPAEEEIYVIGSGFKGPRQSNVIRAHGLMSGAANRPDHPTPKPVGLMEHLIDRCPGGVIADPFAGSGATLIAARNLGRSVIGVEIEERYCELIATRAAQLVFDLEGIA